MTLAVRSAATEQTRARYPDESGYAERGGVKLHYEVYGSGGPTILLLPTWSIVHSRHWKMQIPYLARHCRVVTFDGRGNGRSDRPEAGYDEREFAADALAVMDATGTGRAVIVSLSLENFDGLRLCSQIRSLERTRNIPILALAEANNGAQLARGLEIGVNDYLTRPIDNNELLARVRTQIKKRRYTERLRDNVQMSIEAAITDGLTGLFNRRYMETHLGTLVEQSAARGKPITVLVVDIDYFKAINDGYGHDAGDDVLREFSLRIRKAIRNIDLACRYGGEEFVIVMPETDMAVATMVAERMRRRIASEPFTVEQGKRSIEVTISIGISALSDPSDTAATILKRADQALYRAKRDGRNRVVPDAA